jgi:acetyltransferase
MATDPANYPESYTETLTLKDGRQVLMRPIRPDDAPRLQDGFKRLSPESIYMRFLEITRSMSDEQARRLSTVDYDDQMAFVAVDQNEGREYIVGVARYSVLPDSRPRMAEAGIIVGDPYQGNGLGKLLVAHLVRYALEKEIKIFYGTIHTTNQRIMNFIRHSGFCSERNMLEPGVWEYKIFLDRPGVDGGA